MRRPWLPLVVSLVLVASGNPAGAGPAEPVPRSPVVPSPPGTDQEWSPPVDGPVVRVYEPPKRPFGPQHLGLDFGARPGSPVRAAGAGVVDFAGLVGRSRSVAVEHAGGRRTTYAYLRRVLVRVGAPVRRGDLLGFSGGAGPGHEPDVVHFGYRVNGLSRDPAELFASERPRISLAPLDNPACPSSP